MLGTTSKSAIYCLRRKIPRTKNKSTAIGIYFGEANAQAIRTKPTHYIEGSMASAFLNEFGQAADRVVVRLQFRLVLRREHSQHSR